MKSLKIENQDYRAFSIAGLLIVIITAVGFFSVNLYKSCVEETRFIVVNNERHHKPRHTQHHNNHKHNHQAKRINEHRPF